MSDKIVSSNPTIRRTKPFHGIVDWAGVFFVSYPVVYALFVPVTTIIARPGGYIETAVEVAFRLIPGTVPKDRTVVALAVLYGFFTIPVFHSFKLTAQIAGIDKESLMDPPRRARAKDLDGIPLRAYKAYRENIEDFTLWALAAVLTQMLDPTNQAAINLLALAAMVRILAYWPAFVFNLRWLGPWIAVADMLPASAAVNVLLRLATGFEGYKL